MRKLLGFLFLSLLLSGCADLTIGALEGLAESGRSENISKKAWGELGYDKKEFKDVAYRIDKFGECAEIIKVNENYKFFINKSPKNKSYEHYSDKTYVNQAEKMSISWLGNEVDKCSSHIREAKYSSPMAQEFILIPQRLVVQQLFLLASLDNKEITWGQYNRKTEEIDNFAAKKTSDFVERMKNQSYQVKNRIMILNEVDEINRNRAYLDAQLQKSRNELRSLKNENRRIENERRRLKMCAQNPGEYWGC